MDTVLATPQPFSLTLQVGGMTCASCSGRVEKALRGAPGVHGASVNLATEKVTVTGAAPLDADGLIAAIVRAGFTASPLAADTDTDTDTAPVKPGAA